MMDNGLLSLDIEINTEIMSSLLHKLSCDNKVVIGICNDDNRDSSLKEMKKLSEAIFAKNKKDIVCLLALDNIILASEYLVNSEAEVIVWYISENSKSIFHTLQTEEDSFALHKEWIKDNRCNYIITWVVNEDGLYLHYDPRQIKKKELLSRVSSL